MRKSPQRRKICIVSDEQLLPEIHLAHSEFYSVHKYFTEMWDGKIDKGGLVWTFEIESATCQECLRTAEKYGRHCADRLRELPSLVP